MSKPSCVYNLNVKLAHMCCIETRLSASCSQNLLVRSLSLSSARMRARMRARTHTFEEPFMRVLLSVALARKKPALLCLRGYTKQSPLSRRHLAATGTMCIAHHSSLHACTTSWDSSINGLLRSGQPLHALSLYHQLQQQEETALLSPATLVALLKACAELNDPLHGRELHAHISRMGFVNSDAFLGSSLIDMYAKCGSLAQAQQVLDKLPIRNVVVWTALIAGYAEHGYGRKAIILFEEMQRDGVCPDDVTYICSIKACGSIGALYKGQTLHAEITMKGIEINVFLSTTVVDMYVKCGDLPAAQGVFDRLSVRNEVACTALIVGYTEYGHAEEALHCFQQMQREGIRADTVTFACSLKACGVLGAIKKGHQLHAQITKEGVQTNLIVSNSLIDMYGKSGALAEAQVVLDKLSLRNVVSWNALIAGCVEHDHGLEALRCFKLMQFEGISPDAATLSCMPKACGLIGKIEEGQEIHVEIARKGLATETLVGNALVDMYAKFGLFDKAWEVFEKLSVQDVVPWTSLITGYAEYGSFVEALNCFDQMQHAGISPDTTAYLCIFKACSGLGVVDKCQEFYDDILQNNAQLDSIIGSSLVNMYAQCGWIEKAQEVFDKIPTHNVPLFNALITGYAQVGEVERVFLNIGTMIAEGLKLNLTTLVNVFSVCSHAGLVDKWEVYLVNMSKYYDLIPGPVHYNCVVDLLCRAGSVDMAVEVVQKMPFQPVSVIWHGILGVCQKCGSSELGVQAFQFAVELDKWDSSTYISILNTLAMEEVQERGNFVMASTYTRSFSQIPTSIPTL